MEWDRRCALAECIGTFALVFFGTGAIVVNDLSNGAVTHLGISLVFGFVVLAMIFTLGGISGSHLNPAVTLGLYTARKFPGRKVVSYITSQSVGAIVASFVIWILFPLHENLGATFPSGTVVQSFALEVILTFVLMFAVLRISERTTTSLLSTGVVIGAIIAIEAIVGGPISGASMNPARSLGPAVVSLNFHSLWVYLFAPALGALLGVGFYKLLGADAPLTSARPA